MPRIVQARKPGSKPYLSLNMPKALQDPDAERKVNAFFKKSVFDRVERTLSRPRHLIDCL